MGLTKYPLLDDTDNLIKGMHWNENYWTKPNKIKYWAIFVLIFKEKKQEKKQFKNTYLKLNILTDIPTKHNLTKNVLSQ